MSLIEIEYDMSKKGGDLLTALTFAVVEGMREALLTPKYTSSIGLNSDTDWTMLYIFGMLNSNLRKELNKQVLDVDAFPILA